MLNSSSVNSAPIGLLNSTEQKALIQSHLDHTKLAFASEEDPADSTRQLCEDAKAYQFYAVCVRPQYVPLAKAVLSGSDVRIATVVGFPWRSTTKAEEANSPSIGNVPLSDKLAELKIALQSGADELDVVLNVGQFKQEFAEERWQTGETWQSFQQLQAALVQTKSNGGLIKLIIETDLLTDAEIVAVTELCARAGLGMVKTSTGFVSDGVGATVAHIALIRETLDRMAMTLQEDGQPLSRPGIKASGGIKTLEKALALIEAGATRLGASAGIAILKEIG